VKKFCGDVQRAAEALDCIKPRLSEVSKRCKDALAKVAVPFDSSGDFSTLLSTERGSHVSKSN
jgi:hypothetical protein